MKADALPRAPTAKEENLEPRLGFPASPWGSICLLAARGRHSPARGPATEGESTEGPRGQFRNETPSLALQCAFISHSSAGAPRPLLELWKSSSFLDTTDCLETSLPTSHFILPKERKVFRKQQLFRFSISFHPQSRLWKNNHREKIGVL